MASRPDPLIEALVGLASNAAPLLERARASGMFRPVAKVEPTTAQAPAAEPADAAQKTALHEIIVAQAIKIHALEAEIAAWKRENSPANS